MSVGVFTVDSENRVTVIKDEILRYAKKDNQVAQWYPSGQMVFNDIVIRIRIEEEIKIEIFCWKNNDMIPVKKCMPKIEGKFFTVFFSNAISIELIGNVLRVSNKNHYREFPSDADEVLVIFRHEQIVFYSHEEGNKSHCIQNVLEGNPYKGHIDEGVCVRLENFFPDEIVLPISQMNKEGQKEYVTTGAANVCICLEVIGKLNGRNRVFSIGDIEAYVSRIKTDTGIFNVLYSQNEMKLYENQLDNVARLKGFGKNVLEINKKFEKVCRKNVTIVLTGESGTGKTYFANQIHKNSKRRDKPFISVNCAAIATNLIESELFGYEDGAFTGAKKGGKPGYFEMANGGTLFLDEISELPLLLQGKLLEVLQESTFYRVGGTKKIAVDIRLIVATNRNLEKMVRDGLFREDLYYRINVFPIHLPPLRERTDDMYSIMEDTLPAICKRLDMEVPVIQQDAMDKIRGYSWPGNIRELENVLEKAAVMSENNMITSDDIVINNNVTCNVAMTLKDRMADYEKMVIMETYEKFDGNRKQMAEYLGMSKTNLFEKIHKYGLE